MPLKQSFVALIALIITSGLAFSQDWNEIIRLHSKQTEGDQQFGYSVDIQENTAIVGANGSNGSSVHVFEKTPEGSWEEIQELRAKDSKPADQFGVSVSIDDNIIVIGSSWADVSSGDAVFNDAGVVYVFEKMDGKWEESAKLSHSDPFTEDQFGTSVDVSGNRILIGAIWNDYDEKGKKARQDAGAAYIFEKVNGQWKEKQKLVADDRKSFDLFGISVSLDKNRALIGAYRQGFDSRNKNYLEFSGAAYVFEVNEEGLWQEKQKLSAEKRTAGSFFGYSVSLKNDLAIIGAQEHALDVKGESLLKGSGAAYVFEKNNTEWQQVQKLTALDRQAHAYFGESVYTDGKRCIIGAWGEKFDRKGLNPLDTAGAAYVFEKDNSNKWVQKAKLIPVERQIGEQFGISVAIDGDYAIGGAWSHDYIGEDTLSWSGAAYVFGKCDKPNLSIMASNEFIKSGEDVVLSAEGADYIQWSGGIENNISFKPETSSVYEVLGRDEKGCYSKDAIEIFVRQAELEVMAIKDVDIQNVVTETETDFRIIQLEDNRNLKASTKEIVQKYKGMSIISRLKFEDNGDPAANVNVLLLDENGMVLKRGITDEDGQAKFTELDPDKSYDVIIDKNDPQLNTKVKKDGKTVELTKNQFIDEVSGFTLLSHIEYKESSEPASNVFVLLLNEEGLVLKKGKTNAQGIAHFQDLENDKNYQVIIDKNHPSVKVDYTLDGRIVTIDTKQILENFERLTILGRMAYQESEEPAANIPVMLVDENGLVLKRGTTNQEGMAMFIVPDDKKKYKVVVDEDLIDKREEKISENDREEYDFEKLYFDFNSFKLKEQAKGILIEIANVLKENPDKKLIIHAHTDGIGTEEANQFLAEKRGEAVKKFLVARGLNSERIEIDPVGSSQPVASNSRDEGRKLNRRVEFELSN